MKRLMKCRLCGGLFEQEFYFGHVCGECLDDATEARAQRQRKFIAECDDPAVKARIKAGVAEALDVDLTSTRARPKPKREEAP